VVDERAADLRAMGLPEDQIAKIAPEQAAVHFEVLPENWEAVQFFLRCQTQWRTGGGGGMVGMDYGAIAWLLRLYRVKDQRAILEDLQVMEATVLETMAKKGG
jgi:hypothetical protein